MELWGARQKRRQKTRPEWCKDKPHCGGNAKGQMPRKCQSSGVRNQSEGALLTRRDLDFGFWNLSLPWPLASGLFHPRSALSWRHSDLSRFARAIRTSWQQTGSGAVRKTAPPVLMNTRTASHTVSTPAAIRIAARLSVPFGHRRRTGKTRHTASNHGEAPEPLRVPEFSRTHAVP